MLLASKWTFRRRVLEYGMVDLVGFSKISNEELYKLIRHYRNIQCLVYGCSMILEHFHSRGIEVQQKRVVKSIVCVNPNGCHIRYSLIVRNKRYDVAV